MELCVKRFDELSTREMYDVMRLRQDVFVVEQNCLFHEMDGRDFDAIHVFLRDENGIQAYLRVMDRNVISEHVSIGRVIAVKRRCGMGSRIVQAGIKAARDIFHAGDIYLKSELYAKGLYEKQGFEVVSQPFLEDNIAHVSMILKTNVAQAKRIGA